MTFYLFLKNDVNVPSNSTKQMNFIKHQFFYKSQKEPDTLADPDPYQIWNTGYVIQYFVIFGFSKLFFGATCAWMQYSLMPRPYTICT